MERHSANPFLRTVSNKQQDIGNIVRDGMQDAHDMNFRDYHEVKLLKLELSQRGWVLIKGQRQKDDHATVPLNQYIDHQRTRPIISAVSEGTWKAIPMHETSSDKRKNSVSPSRDEVGYDLSSLECYHPGGVLQDQWSVTVVRSTTDKDGKEGEHTIQMNGTDIFLCSSALPHTRPVARAPLTAEDEQVLHIRYRHVSRDLIFRPPCYEAVDAGYPAAVRFLVPRPSELVKLERREEEEEEEEEGVV